MILLIDWGNSQLKFILSDGLSTDKLKQKQPVAIADLQALVQPLQAAGRLELALICSVRDEMDNQRLQEMLQPFADELCFANSSQVNCGIRCAYAEPERLGVDRWLALLAAKDIASSIGVIDIGSAITLDLLVNNEHLGGHIIPGRRLMFDSLLTTARVKPEFSDLAKEKLSLGRSTSDCVLFGIDAAIQGYLLNTIKTLEKEFQLSHWVTTGGGADWAELADFNDYEISTEPLLVFIGLLKWYLDTKK